MNQCQQPWACSGCGVDGRAPLRRCHPSRWPAAPSGPAPPKPPRPRESLRNFAATVPTINPRSGRSSPRFQSRHAAGGSSCGGGLSSQVSSAALSQNSSERVVSSNAIIHAGCWRRQASHSFRCNQRSCRLIILHTRTPGGWFGRRGRSEDAPRGAFDYVPSRQFHGNAAPESEGATSLFLSGPTCSAARRRPRWPAPDQTTIGRLRDYWRRRRCSRQRHHQINSRDMPRQSQRGKGRNTQKNEKTTATTARMMITAGA